MQGKLVSAEEATEAQPVEDGAFDASVEAVPALDDLIESQLDFSESDSGATAGEVPLMGGDARIHPLKPDWLRISDRPPRAIA